MTDCHCAGKPFIRVDSDYGWIGNIHWANSETMPSHDLFTMTMKRWWGAFACQEPGPSCNFRDEAKP
jgi:hypothetical protein